MLAGAPLGRRERLHHGVYTQAGALGQHRGRGSKALGMDIPAWSPHPAQVVLPQLRERGTGGGGRDQSCERWCGVEDALGPGAHAHARLEAGLNRKAATSELTQRWSRGQACTCTRATRSVHVLPDGMTLIDSHLDWVGGIGAGQKKEADHRPGWVRGSVRFALVAAGPDSESDQSRTIRP